MDFEKHFLLGGISAETVVEEMKHGHRVGTPRNGDQIGKVFLDSYMSGDCIFKSMNEHCHEAILTYHVLFVAKLGLYLLAFVAGVLNDDLSLLFCLLFLNLFFIFYFVIFATLFAFGVFAST